MIIYITWWHVFLFILFWCLVIYFGWITGGIITSFIISEGISSTWHYHYSNSKTPSIALCGAKTMITNLPLDSWGHYDNHIGQKYCKKCQELISQCQNKPKGDK